MELPGAFPSSIGGFKIEVSSFLKGGKKAIKQGDTIYVSPAMYSLMQGTSSNELKHLLKNIEVVDIGDPPSFEMPLTTRPE